ncbi:MAG TPA: cupredoxin domain-containing protein [Symbiobacteriaceae bacterium]|nr:cupredoxin domain-containing protein [Symbiobacteriaceae bacterium]
MRMKTALALTLAAVALAAAGCGTASGREIPIEMTNYKLAPAMVEVKAGETVQFVLTNKSDAEHEYESDDGKFEEVLVPAGKTRKVAWTAPSKAGEYEFECDMAGHDGMTMMIHVTN